MSKHVAFLSMIVISGCNGLESGSQVTDPVTDPATDLAIHLKTISSNKRGLEIGGPSSSGSVIYKHAASLDNLVNSQTTVWAKHGDTYNYADNKSGKVVINDATELTAVKDASYEFMFASHVLEHIANPLKALEEWKRVVVPGGYIILILPEKSRTFDHRRSVTPFARLLAQYQAKVGEDDLSSLEEILELHDLSMDPAAGTKEEFRNRSRDNKNNRCLHHFVYSPDLLNEISLRLGLKFVYTITDGVDIWFIAQKPL